MASGRAAHLNISVDPCRALSGVPGNWPTPSRSAWTVALIKPRAITLSDGRASSGLGCARRRQFISGLGREGEMKHEQSEDIARTGDTLRELSRFAAQRGAAIIHPPLPVRRGRPECVSPAQCFSGSGTSDSLTPSLRIFSSASSSSSASPCRLCCSGAGSYCSSTSTGKWSEPNSGRRWMRTSWK